MRDTLRIVTLIPIHTEFICIRLGEVSLVVVVRNRALHACRGVKMVHQRKDVTVELRSKVGSTLQNVPLADYILSPFSFKLKYSVDISFSLQEGIQ